MTSGESSDDNVNRQVYLHKYLPPLAAVLLIALFARLGFWQLDRAAEKIAMQQAFDQPEAFQPIDAIERPDKFEPLTASGRYDADHQVLIDNAIVANRLGYFVITPLDTDSGTVLVNRGWVPKDGAVRPDVVVATTTRTVHGKSSSLPQVGIRPGPGFVGQQTWPRIAVWPTLDEVAQQLGRDVLPFVLLLEPDDTDGYVRQWRPQQAGPSKHYGYAFQWFAMASAVAGLLIWQLRRNRKTDDHRKTDQ